VISPIRAAGIRTTMNPLPTLLASLLGLATLAAEPHPFLIGTGNPKQAKGIYAATFDESDGSLGPARLVTEARGPGFLAFHPRLPVVYAVGHDWTGAYRYADDGALEPINRLENGDRGGCHLEVHPSGKGLAVANYNGGSLTSFLLGDDGRLLGPAHLIEHQGSSAHPKRQTAPHAHGTHFHGDLLAVPDLGIDQTLLYTFDAANGKHPRPADPPALAAGKPGDGPRHAAFHPSGDFLFVNHELTSQLEAYFLDDDEPTSIARLSTLPDDFEGGNSTAEIEVHPDGRWIFVSNRGHNSIAVFDFDPQVGTLERHSVVPCGIEIPRHFTLSPSGKWLLVAGQRSNDVRALSFDPASGELELQPGAIEVPSPICLKFLPRPERKTP